MLFNTRDMPTLMLVNADVQTTRMKTGLGEGSYPMILNISVG